jgi:hypothetical protein
MNISPFKHCVEKKTPISTNDRRPLTCRYTSLTVTAGGMIHRHWPGLVFVQHTAARDRAWPNEDSSHYITYTDVNPTIRHVITNPCLLLLSFILRIQPVKVTMATKRMCLGRINTTILTS